MRTVSWIFALGLVAFSLVQLRGSADRHAAVAARGQAAPRYGEALEVALGEPPAAHYVTSESVDHVHRLLFADHDRIDYDPAFARAARELARFQATHGTAAPGSLLWFFLDSAGVAAWGVRQSLVTTNQAGQLPLATAVDDVIARYPSGRIRLGIAEVLDPELADLRHIAIVSAASGLGLEPVPRCVEPGAGVLIAGELPAATGDAKMLVMGPDLELRAVPLSTRGRRFRGRIEIGELRGAVHVEILASTDAGPSPLAQLELHAGEPSPRRFRGRWSPDESGLTGPEAAEDLAFELLNGDRARLGLAALSRDPALAAIARAHSADMLENGFVGHVSPRTGGVRDRVRNAGYQALRVAENVAQHSSVHGAQSGLFRSLGHRRNIVAADVTHAGIGVAFAVEDDHRMFYVTQIFSRPLSEVEPAAAAAEVVRRVNAARRAGSLAELAIEPWLAALADEAAASGEIMPKAIAERAVRADRGVSRAYVLSLQLWELDQLEIPGQLLAGEDKVVGVGVRVRDGGDEPRLLIVIVAGR